MKVIKKAVLPAPEPLPPAPTAPTIDMAPLVAVMGALKSGADALAAQTESLARLVVESRKGPVKVEIERDDKGRMSNLIISPIAAKRYN